MTRFSAGILGQALAPLALGTLLVVGITTAINYQMATDWLRGEALHDIRERTQSRTAHEQAEFDRVAFQVRHCRDALASRMAAGAHAGVALAREVDGAARRLPRADGPPLSLFVAAGVADEPAQMAAAAQAGELLGQLGAAWDDDHPELIIAAPGRWMAGWGAAAADQVASMLPSDPVLLPVERALLERTSDLAWSRTYLEPATGRWHVVAMATLTLPGVGPCAVIRRLEVDDVLARATGDQLPGSETVVYDRSGRLLAHSRLGQRIRAAGGDLTLELAGEPLLAGLRRAIADDGLGAELVSDVQGRGVWYGISRFPGPGWIIATVHSNQVVERRARQIAGWVLLGGGVVLACQCLLLLLVLRARVARPLHRLSEAAGAMAAGRRDLALDTGRADEIGGLSRAFAAMAEAVAAGERELRAALATLREREELARALVDSAADAVLRIENGRIADVNPRAAALFAAEAGVLLGRELAGLAPVDQPSGGSSYEVMAKHLAAVSGGATQHFAWSALRIDGSAFDAEIGLARVDLPGPVRLLAVVRDVTQRNRLEEQVRHGDKMESLGQLAGGLAHDFNNVLAGIIGSSELLLRDGEADADRERRGRLLRTIITACERAAGLTRKLLTFAHRRAGPTAPVDLHQVVRDTVAVLEHTIDKRITIRTAFTAPRAVVLGDVAQLQNTLLNLALNARDAMPDGGDLVFSSRQRELVAADAALLAIPLPPGNYLEIAVADTGSGIPADVLPRIFDPFFTTKPVGKGTGLGLASVYRTLQDHGGSVAVETAPGRGATFRLLLPYAAPDRMVEAPRSVDPGQRRGMILVIDDEEFVRAATRGMLESLGYAVEEASGGESGIELYLAHRRHIRAVLLDMEMPRMRGIDCLRKLREHDPGVVAVLCSGFARDLTWDQLKAEGFRAQLVKPYRLSELARTLDEVIGAAKDGAP
jgi:PAS domain S-box-containing protein